MGAANRIDILCTEGGTPTISKLFKNIKLASIANCFSNVKFWTADGEEDVTSSKYVNIGSFIDWDNISDITRLFGYAIAND